MSSSVSDLIVEKLTPIYGVPTEIGPDAGSVQELLKRWWSAEGNSGNPTNQKLWDRYTLAGAVGATLQDKAYDFWSRGLLKSALKLPGTTGNYISTPDSVLNSVTGDIDIRVKLSMDTWTPGANSTILSKRSGGNGTSYEYRMTSANRLQLIWSENGSTTIFPSSTVGVPFVAGAVGWIRATLDVDNGAGQNVTTFYTSTDGVTWAVLGAIITNTGVTSIFDSTSPLYIGAFDATSNPLAGTIYYVEIRNGIEGKIVAKFDASQYQVSGLQLPVVLNGWTPVGSALIPTLDYDYIRHPGTVNNVITYPDTADVSVLGDIDVRAKVALDDWTPSGANTIIAKWNGAGFQSYIFRVNAGGALQLILSSDGTNNNSATSTVVNSFVDGSVGYIRATWSDANNQVNFYTSSDGVTWALLGTANVALASAGIADTTALLTLGAEANGGASNRMTGNLYWAEVRNGIGGTVVASFDARSVTTPWTITGSGWNWQGANVPAAPTIAWQGSLSGDNITTPLQAAFNVTDLDVVAKITPTTWLPGAARAIISRGYGVASQQSWILFMGSTGTLALAYSIDGTNVNVVASSVLGYSVGVTKYVRCTRISSSGVANFYTSDDGRAWTLITNTSGPSGTLFPSNQGLRIGQDASGIAWSGNIHYAEVRNGIDGPIVARFDPTAIAKTGTRLPAAVSQVPGGNSSNLLTPNTASIETDASAWAASTNSPTLAQDATQFLDGTKSLSLVATAVGPADMGAVVATALRPAVVPGKVYTGRANSRADIVVRNFSAQINWYTAAGSYISTAGASSVTNSNAAWTESSVLGLAPPTAAFGSENCYIAATVVGEKHFFDRISLVETPTPWTFNGSAWDLVAA